MINRNLIILDSDVKNRDEALHEMIDSIALEGLVTNKSDFMDSVIMREEQASTSIGFSIAIPHGKSDTVQKPFVSFMRTRELIEWSADSEDVSIIFLLGLPKEGSERDHLLFLSTVSRKLVNQEFREDLMKLNTIDDIYELLDGINIELKKGGVKK